MNTSFLFFPILALFSLLSVAYCDPILDVIPGDIPFPETDPLDNTIVRNIIRGLKSNQIPEVGFNGIVPDALGALGLVEPGVTESN